MNELWSDDERDAGPTQLTINEHYAKAFAHRKEREELARLTAKYGADYDPDAADGDDDGTTDDESAESEDEHGEELTPAVDAAILRTLARIKKRDPEIYNAERNIFGDEREKVSTAAVVPGTGATKSKSKSKSKPVTIKQVNLEALLNPSSRSPSPEAEAATVTYAQEQEALRRDTIAAFQHAAETAGDEDDFLVPREKTRDEQAREEAAYRAFLEREVGDLTALVSVEAKDEDEDDPESVHEEEAAAAAEGKKTKKKKKGKSKKAPEETPKKSKAEEDQEFLLNYILNRGWIDKSEGHVPTYHEVTEPLPERRKKKQKATAEGAVKMKDEHDDDDDEMDTGLLSDTSFESLASHFEASYNHRFEEPGAAAIPAFPRTLPALVRRADTTRKDARARKKERKAAELATRRAEVRRMKALKMRDVRRKLALIGAQGGLRRRAGAGGGEDGEGEDGDGEDGFMDEALRELDLEGEWDPEKHDRQMAGLFDRGADAFEDAIGADEEDEEEEEEEEAFGDDDGVNYDEDGKPVWEEDVDIGDIPISDDDAHVIYGAPEPGKKDKKKKKKKKKDGEDGAGVDVDAMDADAAPAFEDEEEWDGSEEMRKRIFNKYMDEIYGLDFNDMVGELPTRFKYVPVQPQNYALAPAEILMATDQELNEYMSVKKYAPYREDKHDRQRWNPQAQEKLREIRSRVSERSGGRFASSHAGGGGSRGAAAGGEDGAGEKKKRMGKKERLRLKAAADQGAESTPAADADGGSETAPAKAKKRKHGQDQNDGELAGPTAQVGEDEGDGSGKKKRKRKHKKREGEE